MVTLVSFISSLDPDDWYAVLDLKEAYFPVAIHQGHRKLLRFVVANVHYQFKVLLFDLSSAL